MCFTQSCPVQSTLLGNSSPRFVDPPWRQISVGGGMPGNLSDFSLLPKQYLKKPSNLYQRILAAGEKHGDLFAGASNLFLMKCIKDFSVAFPKCLALR